MYQKLLVRLFVILFLFSLNGCVYFDVTVPLDTDLDKTQLGDKTGKASMYSVLWLVAWGDAGTKAAAKEGHLTTINHADRHIFTLFCGLYTKETLIVYGE
jgi:hypothetical protein